MIVSSVVQSFIIASNRSWWQLHYNDGEVKSEWQEHPGGSKIILPSSDLSSISEWENTGKKNLTAAILLCPNGQAGGFNEPPDDRMFQFKVGHVHLMGPDGPWCSAHILGCVIDADGNCDYFAWEPSNGRLVKGRDNVYDMKYMNIGRLAIDTSLQLKI